MRWAVAGTLLALSVCSVVSDRDCPAGKSDADSRKPQSPAELRLRLRQWEAAVRRFTENSDGTARLTAEEEHANDKEKRRWKQALFASDLEDGSFSGEVDEDGLPNSWGTYTFDEEALEQAAELGQPCRGKSCGLVDGAVSLTGIFSHGSVSGVARIAYANDSFVVAEMRRNSLHGAFVFVDPELQNSHVSFYAKGQPLAGAAVITVQPGVVTFAAENFTLFLYSGESDCEPVLVTAENAHYTVQLSVLDFPHLEIHSRSELSGSADWLDPPKHLRESNPDTGQIRAILAGLYLLKCSMDSFKPNDSIVKDPALLVPAPTEKEKVLYQALRETDQASRVSELSSDAACSSLYASIAREAQEGAFRQMVFACFPGSGSRWFLDLLEESSGIAAHMSAYAYSGGSVPGSTGMLLKTHHRHAKKVRKGFRSAQLQTEPLDLRLWFVTLRGGRAVIMLRNPLEAIVSWRTHVAIGFRHDVKEAEFKYMFYDGFENFAETELLLWRELALDYLTMATSLQVVHFENVRQDWEREVRRTLAYLRAPVDEARVECLRRNPIGTHKRSKRPKLTFDPFSPKLRKLAEEIMAEVDQALRKGGHQPLPTSLYNDFLLN